MKRDEDEGMSTDFPSRWAPDEGLSASIKVSSQEEDIDKVEGNRGSSKTVSLDTET